jgi:hypothetical protein
VKHRILVVAMAVIVVAAAASAQSLQGTVNNATTGKPAAGADVVLLSLSQGMVESARAQTDAAGRFTLKLDNPGAPHLVRVNHQKVNYFRMAPPGTTSVQVQVYDSAPKLDGISNTVDVVRYQADATTLQVAEIWAVHNDSKPPRTLMADRTYEIVLPEGATVDAAAAKAPGGQPVNTAAVPVDGRKGHYYFTFPLRPGETEFQVQYHLNYSGQTTVKPALSMPVQHFVVMLPKSMTFSPGVGSKFAPMDDPSSTIQVATNVGPSDALAYSISGRGTLADENAVGANQQGGGAMADNRGPGGGIGKPIDSPDPLTQYRWPMLGLLAAVLVAGGLYVVTRKGEPAPALAAPTLPVSPVSSVSPVSNAVSDRKSTLLEAMKEELFQLEVDRQQGRITEEEYQKAKAGLDLTIRRAVNRDSQRQ